MFFAFIFAAIITAVTVYFLCGLNENADKDDGKVGCILALIVGVISTIVFFVFHSLY